MSKFYNQTNEAIFKKYEEEKTNEGMGRASINQYRSGVYTLEQVAKDNDLSKLSIEAIKAARQSNKSKTNHMNSFVIDTFNADLCNYSTDVILYCVNERERKALKKILEKSIDK